MTTIGSRLSPVPSAPSRETVRAAPMTRLSEPARAQDGFDDRPASSRVASVGDKLERSPRLQLVRAFGEMAQKYGVPAELPVMAALVESNFDNLPGTEREGAGVFQQRGAWGPLAVRGDPMKACKLFLLGGRGGQKGAVDYLRQFGAKGPAAYGEWCQAVQVTAFPARYQQRLAEARALLRQAGVAPGVR